MIDIFERKMSRIFDFYGSGQDNKAKGKEALPGPLSDIARECVRLLRDHIEDLDEGRMTPEEARMAVIGEYPDAIALLRNQTPEHCRVAVGKDWRALRHVRDENKTLAICRLAMEQSPDALMHVPDALKGEFVEQAVRGNGLILERIPCEFQTEELCVAAVLRDPEAMWFVDDRFADAAKKALAQAREKGE